MTRLLTLALLLVISALVTSPSLAQTINHQTRGNIEDNTYNFLNSGSGAAFQVDNTGINELRNWFQFDTTNSLLKDGLGNNRNRWVTNAGLRVFNNSTTGSVTEYTLYDVAAGTAPSETQGFFDDLGTGVIGSTTNVAGNSTQTISFNLDGVISLNQSTIAGIDSGTSSFVTGGGITAGTGTMFDGGFSFVHLSDLSIDATVANSGPIAFSDDYVYDFNVGGNLLLDGSGSFDDDEQWGDFLTYEWDINGDGDFTDAGAPTTSATVLLTEADLEDLLIPTTGGNITGQLRVTDAWGFSATSDFTVSVTAVPEPAGLAALGILVTGGLFFRSRRKQQQLPVA